MGKKKFTVPKPTSTKINYGIGSGLFPYDFEISLFILPDKSSNGNICYISITTLSQSDIDAIISNGGIYVVSVNVVQSCHIRITVRRILNMPLNVSPRIWKGHIMGKISTV